MIVKVRVPAPEIVNLGVPAGDEPTCDIVGVPLTLCSELATYSIPVGKVIVTVEVAEGRVTLTVSVPASKSLLAKCTGSSAKGCDSIACAATLLKGKNNAMSIILKNTLFIVFFIFLVLNSHKKGR